MGLTAGRSRGLAAQSWAPRLGSTLHASLGLGTGRLRFTTCRPRTRSWPCRRRRARGLIAAADEIMGGRWHLLGSVRLDMEDPDWFFDPVTGRRAPQLDYCFKVNHRAEDVTGNVKQIWELSRMHHVTVLASSLRSLRR